MAQQQDPASRAKDDKPKPPPPAPCPPHNWTISGHIATCSKCGASQNVSSLPGGYGDSHALDNPDH